MKVPKMRFPEFRNGNEWKEISFIDLADKKVKWSFTGGPFGSNLKASDYVTKGIRVIQLQNIGDGEFIDEYKIFTSKQKADELLSCNIYPGEIILSKMGDPVGRACLIPESNNRYVMCSDGIRLVVDEEKYSKYFIYSLINSKHFRPLVEKTATGSTRKRIGLEELKELPLVVPQELKEQQKIASCLSSLDDLINAHIRKLDNLKVYKTGLMQNLFPSLNEETPKLRFPQFTDTLIKVGLEEIGEIKIGLTHTPNYIESGVPFLSSKNISNGYIDFQNIQYISREEFDEMTESAKPKAGDILFTRVGSNLGNPIILEEDREFAIFVSLGIFRVNTNAFNYYIKHWMESDYFWTQLEQKVAGGAKNNLNTNWLKEFQLILPSFSEQQKIAACLSSLDELITAQTEKIEQLKKHKKGLMQGLFPGINEEKE